VDHEARDAVIAGDRLEPAVGAEFQIVLAVARSPHLPHRLVERDVLAGQWIANRRDHLFPVHADHHLAFMDGLLNGGRVGGDARTRILVDHDLAYPYFQRFLVAAIIVAETHRFAVDFDICPVAAIAQHLDGRAGRDHRQLRIVAVIDPIAAVVQVAAGKPLARQRFRAIRAGRRGRRLRQPHRHHDIT
jgi:hypothetical protein